MKGFVQGLPSGITIIIMGIIVLAIMAMLAAKFLGYI